MNNILEEHDLSDIWRIKNPDKRRYTWHSSKKPHISSRLDYFSISSCLTNRTTSCKIKAGYRTDHSAVVTCIQIEQQIKGPGVFKFNNSLLLDIEYQNLTRKSIDEIATINKESNAKTLWEIIKGTIRNETIKYASKKKKQETEKEKQLQADIERLEKLLTEHSQHAALNQDTIKNNLAMKKI